MWRRIRGAVCAAGGFAALATAIAGVCPAGGVVGSVPPSDAEIRRILATRVEALAGQEDGIGIVVGVIEPQGRRVISYGHANQGDPRALDGNTGFEIGSVTKVFTALVLADMVRKGEVALTDPVTKYLPATVRIPERNSRSITLLDLATHTSALPFMPDELPDINDRAAKYSTVRLYEFLAGYKLPREPGAQWDYSNIGYWLLGEALAARAGTDYESLLRARVLVLLKLKSTAITPSPEMKARLAVGHNAALQPALAISDAAAYSIMPAAGGLVSTANDMLRFLSVAMGYEPSPLAPAMANLLSTRRPMSEHEAQALGWIVMGEGDKQLIVHDGGSFGFSSSVAWDPRLRAGVVVLSNQVASVGDIARHLLRPDFPLAKPAATKRTEIALGPAELDACTGRYEAQGEGIFVIAREGGFLTIQLPADWGLPKLRLHPERARDFFTTELPLRVTFQSGADGRVSGMLVYPPRGQKAVPASRISSEK